MKGFITGLRTTFRRYWRRVQGFMTGGFLYFGYGSNMLTARLQAKDRAPSATFVATGLVVDRTDRQ
jgi:hypothetical protein